MKNKSTHLPLLIYPCSLQNFNKMETITTEEPLTTSGSENEVVVKFSTLSLHQAREVGGLNAQQQLVEKEESEGFRKAYVRPDQAWEILERSLKAKISNAFISKIRYKDNDDDIVYILTSHELEDAIFKEGILKFELLYYHFNIPSFY